MHAIESSAGESTPGHTADTSVSTVTASDGLRALLTGAVMAPLTGLEWLRVTGDDRVRWLNGMLTNSIQTLTPGEGAYNFALSAQGRIQADATVFALDHELRIETNRAAETLKHLDHFIIMDDVELTRLTAPKDEEYCGLALAGPSASALLSALLPGADLHVTGIRLTSASWHGHAIDLIHAHAPLVPRFELWTAKATLAALERALREAGAATADRDVLEDLRILEGTPLYGIDIRDKELPQETAQPHQTSRALHFAKGCYLGQEIVERIRSRGNVHRTFSGFVLTGALPAPGTALLLQTVAGAPDPAARPVGEITSARLIHLPGGAVQLALGYVRRDALERGEALVYPGGEAQPVRLPFDFEHRS